MKKYFKNLVILMIYFSANRICKNDDINGMILVIGPTRSGKSCFINTITGHNFTTVGDDTGDSTTKNNQLFSSIIDGFKEKRNFYLIDTMGLDDSEESEFADHLIFANTTLFIRNTMQEENLLLHSILIFESLTNDANKLQNTIKKLKSVFSERLSKNSIVVLNKNPKVNPRRLDRLINISNEHKIKYLHWKSGCGENALHNEYYDQMTYLEELILDGEYFNLNDFNSIINQLIEEGKNIIKKDDRAVISKIQYLSSIGTLGLYALNSLNLPGIMLTNIAIWSFDKLLDYLRSNEILLISLAIEKRMKSQFIKDKEDL